MFYSIDSTGGTDTTAVVGDAGDAGFWEQDCSSEFHCTIIDQYKEMEDDLWMLIDRREWREYLKSMWLAVLKMKQYFNVARFSPCKLYYRRLLFSVSGWLGRKGYAKKN